MPAAIASPKLDLIRMRSQQSGKPFEAVRCCLPDEPWRTAGHSLPMLDAAAKTHTLRCCKVYELYLWDHSLHNEGQQSCVG